MRCSFIPRFNENRAPPHCNRAILSIPRQVGPSCRQCAGLRRAQRGVGIFADALPGGDPAGSSPRAVFDSTAASWHGGLGELAACASQPMAFRTGAKIWTKLKTHPDHLPLPKAPFEKGNWRAAPSIQRYLISSKSDLSTAISPGVWAGKAPEKFSAIGPNCHTQDTRYSHREETE